MRSPLRDAQVRFLIDIVGTARKKFGARLHPAPNGAGRRPKPMTLRREIFRFFGGLRCGTATNAGRPLALIEIAGGQRTPQMILATQCPQDDGGLCQFLPAPTPLMAMVSARQDELGVGERQRDGMFGIAVGRSTHGERLADTRARWTACSNRSMASCRR